MPVIDETGASAHWWGADPTENIFMEVTRREDIGGPLLAPAAARGGGVTASYALVPLVRRGDIIVHYDSREEAIVGVSTVVGPAEPAPVFWAARGGYARRAGVRPHWLDGLRVPLDRYRPLNVPVKLREIRQHRDELLALRDQLRAQGSGRPLYFPWIPYGDTLRTFQSYLVKMPRQAVNIFPDLAAAIGEAESAPPPGPPSPADEVRQAVEDAAGKAARRGRGQGFQIDQATKTAVEVRAMNAATAYYAPGWDVEDVHGRESYDLVCRRGDATKHVEVKGTTTDGAEVILTPNEVTHARRHPDTALFILSGIQIERDSDGTATATGGTPHVHDPWQIDNGTLIPVGYRYQPPSEA
jgi:hypothetical protein